jgi:hypothetical protein
VDYPSKWLVRVDSIFTVLVVGFTPRSQESWSETGQPMHLFLLQFGFVLVRGQAELCIGCVVIDSLWIKFCVSKPFWVEFYLICRVLLILG